MAVTTEDSILAILKTFYAREGVANLLFRNSPVLKKIGKTRVEGKEQAFSAMYGFGGAVSSDYTVALNNATNQAKNVEFKVTPGQLFSVYQLNAKEIQASLSRRGAYMKVAGNKHFAATEGMRKSLAAAFYGRGYGEIAVLGTANASVVAAGTTAADITLTLPDDAVMKFDVGSKLAIKTSVAATSESVVMTVTSITGNDISVRLGATFAGAAATDIITIAGSIDGSGNPLMPVGLGGWLPVVGKRTGASWTSYIGTKFFDVTRNLASDRLAGAFYDGSSTNEKKALAVQKLIKKVRRAGSKADLIVLNDDDFFDLSQEIESTNTYFTKTSTKESKKASVGFGEITASFSTNYIENIVDDPYCPRGMFYVLDSDTVELWSYTNTEYVDDGIAGNEPGKVMNADVDNDKGKEEAPYKLLIDDYISVQPGTPTVSGPTSVVATTLFASYAMWNTSVNGVGLFYYASNAPELVEVSA